MSIYLGSNKIDTFGTSINTTTFYDNSIEDAFINRTISTYENNNISFIGAYAFCSCSSLTTIYCEAEKETSGWDSYWKSGCSAQVIWGYKE